MLLRTTALLALLFAVGCSKESMLQMVSSPQDQANAQKYIDYLRSGSLDEIEQAMDPSLRSPNLRDTLVRMAALIPAEEPSSTKVVGAQTLHGPNGVIRNITFEYDFSGKWFLMNVATLQKADAITITGLNVYPRPVSLEEENRFDLAGKTPLQYVILTLVVVLPLLTLFALILCLRTRLSGRKWLWVLFIILGFGQLATNWSTGEWQVNLLSVQVFSASGAAPPYGPWTFAVSVPIGALIFLLRRRAMLASPDGQ